MGKMNKALEGVLKYVKATGKTGGIFSIAYSTAMKENVISAAYFPYTMGAAKKYSALASLKLSNGFINKPNTLGRILELKRLYTTRLKLTLFKAMSIDEINMLLLEAYKLLYLIRFTQKAIPMVKKAGICVVEVGQAYKDLDYVNLYNIKDNEMQVHNGLWALKDGLIGLIKAAERNLYILEGGSCKKLKDYTLEV